MFSATHVVTRTHGRTDEYTRTHAFTSYPKGLMALASRFRGLRSLLIERPRNLDNVDGVLRTLATSPANCNALTDLHLKSCLLGDLGFESICSFSNLSTLDISDNTEFFDYHLQEIVAACPLLTEISLAKCDELANVAPLARCSQLRHIDLRWNEHITDRVMGKIANGCPLLQSVLLTGCKRVTDQTLLHLARGCPELVDVEIMFLADTCTDAGVAALVRGCPKMHPNNIVTYLSVEGTMHGSDETNIKGDETLAAVGETRPNIASLCICNAPLITNTGINALIDGCKQLVSLTLQSCTTTYHHRHPFRFPRKPRMTLLPHPTSCIFNRVRTLSKQHQRLFFGPGS